MSRLAVAAVLLVTALAGGVPAVADQPASDRPAPVAPSVPPKLPVAAFGKLPFVDDPVLSPDGTRIAARLNVNGMTLLGIIDARATRQPPILIPTGKFRLDWCRWAGNDRLVMNVIGQSRLGDDFEIPRLMVYDIPRREVRQLVLNDGRSPGWTQEAIHFSDDGRHILVSASRSYATDPEVYRVDLDTGKWTSVVPQIPSITRWYADADGVVKAGVGIEYRKMKWVYRDSEGQEFQTIGKVDLDVATVDDVEFTSILFRRRGGGGYVIRSGPTGRDALYEFEPRTFAMGKLVFEHPGADVLEAELDPSGSFVESALYADDRYRVAWLDEPMKGVQAEIDEALPGRQNFIVGSTRDRARFLVFTGNSNDPGYYYFFDHGSGVMSRIGMRYQGLKGATLAQVQPVAYQSRDGLTIPGYLTLPVGRNAKGLPLVVLPHGGPLLRDAGVFNTLVQFLANRGYAVLQPNYRGSTGYGRDYVLKGIGQWGTGIANDINDGVRWLVADGVVDPARVCIMGGGFGGYAAIWGAITAPEIYRCAISLGGMTDLEDMVRHDRNIFIPVSYRWIRNRMTGESEVDLKAISPTDQAERLTRPVLLVHGTDDGRVPVEQATKFARILDKHDKTYELLKLEGVSNFFQKDDDQIRFFTAVEDFLARYNPAD